MNEETIKELYLQTYRIVLDGVDDKYAEELKEAYFQYLNRVYSAFDLNGRNAEDVLPKLVKLEVSKWSQESEKSKLARLFKDSALESIVQISNMAFELATEKLSQNGEQLVNTLSEEEANNNIELLNNYLNEVRDFNGDLARNFVSEGIMDFMFASGLSNDVSMRLGRMEGLSKSK